MTEDSTRGPEAATRDTWVAAQFTRRDGAFRFARWGRPLAPVIVGTNDEGCRIFEGGIASAARIAGLEVAELDPDLGANFLVFLVNDWAELTEAPNLIRLIPNLPDLIQTLGEHGANQYRVFNFTEDGAIRLCITLLRYDDELQKVSAQTLALGQALQGLLLWSDKAFMEESPIALAGDGLAVVKPVFADLLRAAYDPVLPDASSDAALALRLAARLTVEAADPA
ncbi:MAG: hypothetical protein AAGB15_04590 [Pseudomonadota bacterium]